MVTRRGSKGLVETTAPGPISLIFMHFQQNLPNDRFFPCPLGWNPILEILDPPLVTPTNASQLTAPSLQTLCY